MCGAGVNGVFFEILGDENGVEAMQSPSPVQDFVEFPELMRAIVLM